MMMNRIALTQLRLILRKYAANPLFPAVSLLGLVIGGSVFLLVSLWLVSELNYDKQYPDADRTYRLTVEINNDETGFHWDFARSWYGWLMHLPAEVPGVESMVRLECWREGVARYNEAIAAEDIFTADAAVIDMFQVQLRQGNPKTCLSGPNQVIISESTAKKYFGEINPIGEIFFLYCSSCKEQKPYRVCGVYNDFPVNTHVHPGIIASVSDPQKPAEWAYYYLTLGKNIEPNDVLAHFDAFASRYVDDKERKTLTPHLQKIGDIHLQSHKDRELEHNGSMQQLKVLAALLLFVLLVTLFNYFNMRYIIVLRDLKLYRLMAFTGARQSGFFSMAFLESVVYSGLASGIAWVLVVFLLPVFNRFMGTSFALNTPGLLLQILISTGSFFLVTLPVGMAPLLIIRSRYYLQKLVSAHPEAETLTNRGMRSRVLKLMVGVQYVAAFCMIMAVVIMNGQLQLFNRNALGGGKEQLLCIKKLPIQVIDKYPVFKEQLLKSSLIKDVTSSMENPGDEIRDMMGFEMPGQPADSGNKLIYVSPVDANFFTFYHIPIVAGSNFPEFGGNNSQPEKFILNEAAVNYLGLSAEEVVGKPFRLNNFYTSAEFGQIVGVVKDFQPSSMTQAILPYVYFQKTFWLFSSQVRFDTTRTTESLQYIRNTWFEVFPGYPFDYDFVEVMYQNIYRKEGQLQKMSLLLCVLSLIIAALGIFAITGITYRIRTKEVGIRKVNGAKVLSLIVWLTRDILKVVLGAVVVAVPLTVVLSRWWLSGYIHAYSVTITMYFLSGLALVSIALLTVGWQTWKAATRNPVNALRYE